MLGTPTELALPNSLPTAWCIACDPPKTVALEVQVPAPAEAAICAEPLPSTITELSDNPAAARVGTFSDTAAAELTD